jgi:endo-1,4-beta-xylanase
MVLPTYCSGSNREFYQYWSIRKTKRLSGTIRMKSHFDSWSSSNRGFKTSGVGNGYQVMGVEAVDNSKGSAKWKLTIG